jgi:hypothetical protein
VVSGQGLKGLRYALYGATVDSAERRGGGFRWGVCGASR